MTTAEATHLRPESTLMFREAAESADVVARMIERNAAPVGRIGDRLRARPPRAVVICARGSSDHAGAYARYLFETRARMLTSPSALSVSSVYEAAPDLSNTLFVAISQSGKSADILAATEAARTSGAWTLAVVNDENSPLAALADEVLPLHAGPELSVAATKSYVAALAATAQLTAAWTGDTALEAALSSAPEALARAWALDWSPVGRRLVDARNFYVLGRGVGLGVAREAALKFKETCGLHAEAFSAAEVRHGPMALVGPGFPILAFAQDDPTRASMLEAAEDLRARGADVFLAASGEGGNLPAITAHPLIEPMLMVQSFYRMANSLAIARGFDPDRPPHLKKVTQTL